MFILYLFSFFFLCFYHFILEKFPIFLILNQIGECWSVIKEENSDASSSPYKSGVFFSPDHTYIYLCFFAVRQRLESWGSVAAAWPRRSAPFVFWCGCSVCSPAPAVCSLPFSHPPLAKSLTPAGPRPHCLRFAPGGGKRVGSFTRSCLDGSQRNQVWCLTCVQTSKSDLPTTAEPVADQPLSKHSWY